MKRFTVTTSDDGTEEKVRGLLYLGNESERADAVEYMLNIDQVVEVNEQWRFANGKSRMTTQQRDKFWELCNNYNVPFDETHYRPVEYGANVYYEGWVGGVQHTIYVGVEPNGRSHS